MSLLQRYSTTYITTNATPVVVFSVPIAEGTSARVDVDFQVINSGLTQAACGSIFALFIRPSGGNVARATGNAGLLSANLTISTNITLNAPQIEIVANTSAQTADVRLTGQAATTLTWKFTPNARRN